MSLRGRGSHFVTSGLVVLMAMAAAGPAWADRPGALGTFVPLEQRLPEKVFSPATATLPDGRILIAGGYLSIAKYVDTTSTAVSIYDPVSGRLDPAGPLLQGRADTTPIDLPNGTFLFYGSDFGAPSTTEIYHPDSGVSEELDVDPPLTRNLAGAPLPDGRILFTGSGGEARQASVLDPTTGIRRRIAKMPGSSHDGVSEQLPDGRILIFADHRYDGSIRRAMVFDPATSTFTLGGKLKIPRSGASTVVLSDGRVLISGGEKPLTKRPRYIRRAEIYDPDTRTSTLTGSLGQGRIGSSTVRLSDGRVLVAGGGGSVRFGSRRREGVTLSSEIFDPATGRFEANGNLFRRRIGAAAIALPGGRALLAGGSPDYSKEGYGIDSLEILEPDQEIAKVKGIRVTPRVQRARHLRWTAFEVSVRNSGQAPAREVKICVRTPRVFFQELECPRLENILPGETRRATLRFKLGEPEYAILLEEMAGGKTKRMEITAIGQDVNVFSTIHLKAPRARNS